MVKGEWWMVYDGRALGDKTRDLPAGTQGRGPIGAGARQSFSRAISSRITAMVPASCSARRRNTGA